MPTIYLKNSNSKTNFQTLQFLYSARDAFSDRKITISLDTPPSNVSRTPALVTGKGAPLIGLEAIQRWFGGAGGGGAGARSHDDDPEGMVDQHWRSILDTGDATADENKDEMEKAKREANATALRRANGSKEPEQPRPSRGGSSHDERGDLFDEEDEPAFQKYWENQRES